MDTFYILVLTIFYILLYIIYRWIIRNQRHWERLGIPYLHSSVPYIGNIWPVLIQRKSTGELYHDIYKSFPNSSMIGLYNCGNLELMLKDPELIKTVLQTNFSHFHENGISFDFNADPLLKRNPFGSSGEKWKYERSVLTNVMSISKLRNMTITIHEVGEKFVKYLQNNMKQIDNNDSLVVNAQMLFARFTGEVVASVGFGIDGKCFEKETGVLIDMSSKIFEAGGLAAFAQILSLLIPSANKIFKARLLPKELDVYCRRVVKDVLEIRKQKGIRGNDFIQHLCDLCKKDNDEIDEDFVTCHATSFYIDGFLTSSHTLSFIAYDIARHSDIQNKLRDEIVETLGKYNGELTYDAIQDMKYLDLVIKESMRVSPVVAAMYKKCTEEFKLIGSDGIECVVKPGTKIVLCPLGLHVDSKYWNDPEVFRPERFDDEHKNDFPKFAYLPFGGGARICVGIRMAMLQMKYAIVNLINNYSLTVSSKTKLPFTFDRVAILNIPEGGIWINIKQL